MHKEFLFLNNKILARVAHVKPFRSYKLPRNLESLIAAVGLILGASATIGFGAVASSPLHSSGVWTNEAFFPIAVWLQSPANAAKYREAGINTYVGLWRGPTQEQLATLAKAGMKLICAQNDAARNSPDASIIIGWMHDDEPDNAQSLGEGKGWGPPVPPQKIISDYEKLRERDPSRPVLLNLGQGVAWDNWHGRGVRSRHPEDYPEYIKGCDVVSFDIYPAVHDHPEVAGKLEFVARGVERLVKWTEGKKPVWNCLECTRIGNEKVKPTPHQVRAEAWMSIVHGSRGLIYFVHQFKPSFREAALLDDPEMLRTVTQLNREIQELAPVINSPEPRARASAEVSQKGGRVALMSRIHRGSLYVFAVEMTGQSHNATIRLPDGFDLKPIQVLGEDRTVQWDEGKDAFSDEFSPWAVHLYKVQH